MKKLVYLVIGIMLYSCSSIKVMSDKDPSTDFSKYKTLEYYGWQDNSDKILTPFDKTRIEKAFGTEFKNRGFNLVEKGAGDIIVSLYVVTEEKTETVANTTTNYAGGGMRGYGYGGYYGYGPGYGWGTGYSNSTTTYSDYDYTVGTLVVSVYDAAQKELKWQAVGTKTIDGNSKNNEAKINAAVAKIMLEYPIAPAK